MFRNVFESRRVRAVALHFGASILIIAVVSALVFLAWYPPPFSSLAGGVHLMALLVGIDVVLGPSLTAVIANPSKPAGELWRDLAVIVVLQLSALTYGVYTISLARPVCISFEVDRFRVVTAADVDTASLRSAPAGLQSLSWTGPKLIAAVKPTDPGEFIRSIELGLAGFDLSMDPRNWRTYASVSSVAWDKGRPISLLVAKYPEAAGQIALVAQKGGQSMDGLRFLPLVAQRVRWVAIVAGPDADIVDYLPLDGFF